jgi:hypothetical protein
LPRIGTQQIENNVLDFLAGDHIALTNEHDSPKNRWVRVAA